LLLFFNSLIHLLSVFINVVSHSLHLLVGIGDKKLVLFSESVDSGLELSVLLPELEGFLSEL
jgi:hypothetical protein